MVLWAKRLTLLQCPSLQLCKPTVNRQCTDVFLKTSCVGSLTTLAYLRFIFFPLLFFWRQFLFFRMVVGLQAAHYGTETFAVCLSLDDKKSCLRHLFAYTLGHIARVHDMHVPCCSETSSCGLFFIFNNFHEHFLPCPLHIYIDLVQDYLVSELHSYQTLGMKSTVAYEIAISSYISFQTKAQINWLL